MYSGIHIPAGCDVLIGDDEASLATVGVLPEDAEATIGVTYDAVEVKGSKNEDVQRFYKNAKAEGKFTIYQILLENLAKFAKGFMTVETVAGSEVSGEAQVIAAGWTNLRLYHLKGQNATKAAPTIVISGATEGEDYFLVQGADDDWYIYFDTSGAGGLSTENAISIANTYTPAASKTAHMGSASVVVTPQVVRFLKTINGKKFQATMWSAANTAGLSFSFPASSQDKPASIDVTLAGGLDTTRDSGKQLMEIVDELGLGTAGVDE